MNKLPDVTQESIQCIDATPNDGYSIRILKAYRENCNCKWSGDLDNPLIKSMNDTNDKRAELLDKAISILENHLGDAFIKELEKDYSKENSDKPLLVPQNNREYWLFTEVWQRCTDFFNGFKNLKGE